MQNVGDVNSNDSPYNPSSLLNADGILNTDPVVPPPVAPHPKEARHGMRSFVFSVLLVLVVAILFRMFVAAPYLVEGASMEHTFQTFDYLIVDRLSYRLGSPSRGDVVVFHFPLDTKRTFIKRIIGLPGDTVTLDGKTVTITNTAHPEGFPLDEPYIAEELSAQSHMTVTVKSEEYFVLGDNRKESADSRYWGALPASNIVGRAFVRLYPLKHINLLPGAYNYNETSSL